MLFVEAIKKTFNETTRSAIREYCGYALKFAPDRLEAGKRLLSCIDNIIDTVLSSFSNIYFYNNII